MSGESWNKAKGIFADALNLAPADRPRFLDEACTGDAETRREVESLLESLDDAGSFLEQSAADDVANVIAPQEAPEAGKRFGHYEIVRQIGAGGMGEVYLANDTKLERSVAVKILNERFSRDGSNLDRFVKEAKAASSLNHPNILVIHEIGLSDEANYIVSEFIEGKTLREIIAAKSLKLPEILDIAVQIANALAAAHAANIVHRDIKPENIIVRPDGFVKILDFGLAKLIDQKALGLRSSGVHQNETAKGMILGTVNYMSPEQAKGESIDARTDVFSFGVLLYEMIGGKTPFAADSMSETFANLIKAEPPPLTDLLSEIPADLVDIVSKTLQKDKDERYQSMDELVGDLKAVRENLAFGKRLEISNSLNSGQVTSFGNEQTDEIKNDVTEQIKQRKPLAAIVAVLLLISLGSGYYFWSSQRSGTNSAAKRSLAVLPFLNASQDPNAEYLSDGVTENIINDLSRLSNLRVMSRNSAFRFKTNQTDTKAIAAQLGVEVLVTGDIKQLGDDLIINVRLIDAADDSQIWGNQYIRKATDVIAAQNEIARAVAQNLRVKLSSTEEQQIAKRSTENAEAHGLYLRGRFHTFKLTPPEIQKGMAYFQQAIEIDPNYALAHVGISDAYRSFALSGEIPAAEVMPKAKAAINKALEIDAALPEAHASLSSIIFWYDWDWAAAEKEIKRSIELNPNSADAHIFYAYLLSLTGRHQESLVEAKRAGELDPLSMVASSLEGLFLFHAGRSDEALSKLLKASEMEPNFPLPHLFAASVYAEKGRYAEAVAEARRARELNSDSSGPVAFLAYALARSGKQDEVRKLLQEMLQESARRYLSPYHIAMIYNALDERDETFAWLERGFEKRDPRMTFLKVEPKWNNLRSEARFVSLLKRMNLE